MLVKLFTDSWIFVTTFVFFLAKNKVVWRNLGFFDKWAFFLIIYPFSDMADTKNSFSMFFKLLGRSFRCSKKAEKRFVNLLQSVIMSVINWIVFNFLVAVLFTVLVCLGSKKTKSVLKHFWWNTTFTGHHMRECEKVQLVLNFLEVANHISTTTNFSFLN